MSVVVSLERKNRQADDVELLSAIARGDSSALGRLYDRYSAILFGLVSRILGDRSEAEDVLQEVFLQVWKKAGDFDERRGRALQWMATVARNRALDRLSTRQSRRRALGEVLAPPLAAESDPVEDASVGEEARDLHRALAEISEPQRNVLLLAYFQGFSQSEIAARLGLPLGTVKSHARLGLLRLRDALRSLGGEHASDRK
jgi:RNA polymerase sigma-70 factor (ECF subfamily)